MKNNAIIIIIACLGILFTSGCDEFEVGDSFLEKPPSVDVTKDTIFSSLEYANRMLTAAYRSLPYNILYFSQSGSRGAGIGWDYLDALGDICQSQRKCYRYYSGQYNAATEEGAYGKYSFIRDESWDGIRKANIFIENIDRVPDADANTIKKLKAEARMIIAVHYCDMYRHFGGVPWLNHAIGPNEDLTFPRLTSLAMMDSIVSVIDKAIPDLPWEIADLVTEDGRFTQAAAMGLKVRLLLFGASPLFNSDTPYLEGEASSMNLVWHGGYDKNLWKKTADAAKEFIDKVESQGGYALVNTGNPREDFFKGYFERGNGEILISTRQYYKTDDAELYRPMYITTVGHGTICATQEYIDMFQMENGLYIDDPLSGYDPNDPNINRDPRLYETQVVNGDIYRGRLAELWVGGRDRLALNRRDAWTGYRPRKFVGDWDRATTVGAIAQFPYLRLPEIYLSYAEALNEFNSRPNNEAYTYVNKVRNRVGMPNLPSGLNQIQFREELIKERAREFFNENGTHFFDLIRWKRESDFTKKLHGMNTWKQPDGSFTYEPFELPGRAWQANWSPKWYLSAFPPSEVQKGYGLTQNPGW